MRDGHRKSLFCDQITSAGGRRCHRRGGSWLDRLQGELRLRLAQRWPWAADISAALTRLQAISSWLTSRNSHAGQEEKTPGPVETRPADVTAGQPGSTQR